MQGWQVISTWEKYREVVIPVLVGTPFSYENQNQAEPQELDAFDRIALSLRSVARPASEDEYEDYNSQESYNPGKKGALA
jgi:hypothetical protein